VKFAHFFIKRPIFAAVLSILTVLIGLISLFELPIAQYPEVAPPTVVVQATYPGASASTVAATVATPIEQEINGVENMLYMSSACTADGTMSLTVTFKTGTDLNNAQVQVQNRVAVAQPKLPEEVRRLGVVTMKRSPSITVLVSLISPDGTFDDLYLQNYANLRVKDVLARLPGVGQVMVFGSRDYSMRIWLDPNKVSARDMTAGEVVAAIREQNIQVAAGVFGQPPVDSHPGFQLSAQVKGQLVTEEEFGNIILKTGADGQITRLRDVARIELGSKTYTVNSLLNGKPAAHIGIFQLPGSNAIETSDAVQKAMREMKSTFPAGLDYRLPFDTTVFVRDSIHAVRETLLEAMLLVVLVVILFLQNWRASIIPLCAVPVSLIGTFAAMQAFGFSLNNLSLFGLVLAIGIVVDDAIVVVENVERNIALGLSPVEATRKAMDEVSGALVAIALVLTAVFVPTAFLSGLTGQFYRQFALTVAVSTLISAFNSLTLSPALAALLLRPHHESKDFVGKAIHYSVGWIFTGFNVVFEKFRLGYVSSLARVLRHCSIALILYVGLLALGWTGFQKVPAGFVPSQDKGYVLCYLQLPDGASLSRSAEVSSRMSEILRSTEGIESVVEIQGFSIMSFGAQANAATMFVALKPFTDRVKKNLSSSVIIDRVQKQFSALPQGLAFVFGAPAVDGLGMMGGFKMQLQDRNDLGPEALQKAAFGMMGLAMQNPSLRNCRTTFRAGVPQVFLDVDRDKARTMNVPLNNVWDALQVYFGSVYVNDFNVFGRPFQVKAQADAPFRENPEDIVNIKIKNGQGDMIPLGSVVKVRHINAPEAIPHYNMYPSADFSGESLRGVSTGEAMKMVEDIAAKVLPPGIGYEWTEVSYLEKQTGNTAIYVFILCVVMAFLLMAALYESWSLPMAIILIVPMCLVSAITGIWLRHMDNNLFTQIGFVVLVGLACKNAILIVEFARQLQEQGRSRMDAALEACRLRLRPILMTSFAFILGVVPLVWAHGAGAEMRQSLGTAVFAGMLGVTFFGIFLTPVFYVIIRRILEGSDKRSAKSSATASHGPGAGAFMVLLGLGMTGLMLAGCSTGPDFKKPETKLDAVFESGTQTNLSDAQPVAAWWRGFQDTNLDALIDKALASNLDLRMATARVRQARALRTEADLDFFPTVTAEGGYTKSTTSKDAMHGFPRSQRENELFRGGFDATWELDIFGGVRRAAEASRADLAAAQATRRDVLVSVAAEVARNYFELRGSQARLDVARRNATNQEQTLQMTLSKVNAGRSTDLDVARSRAQLNATLSGIPPLEAAIARSIHRLSVLTGSQPSALTPVLSTPAPLPTPPALLAIGKPEDLLRRRSDIRAAEHQLHAFTARVGVADADLFPRVTFNGSVAFEAAHLSSVGKAGTDAYSFGPRLSWAALDLGRVRARIRSSKAQADVALAQYEKTVLNALEETENALVDYGRTRARRDYLDVSAQSAAQAYSLAQRRYDGGMADFLSVLDAEKTQLEIQDQLAQSQTAAATTIVAVYKSLGGGWEIESPAQKTPSK
jgi:multidrug efflux pump